MNLSTAKSEKRIKEVGVLKTMGSNRSQLAGQFFVEAVLVAFLALLLTVVIVFSLLPVFNQLTAKQLNLPVASRSEQHTSELQSLMRISYAVFCLQKKTTQSTADNNRQRNNTSP